MKRRSRNTLQSSCASCCRNKRQRGQWTLIGLLITIAIIMILAAWYIPRIATVHSAPGDAPTPMERAYGTACTSYEEQMNQAVTMYKDDNDGKSPTSVEQLKRYGVTEDMIHSEGCNFVIDQSTGQVTDIGHGRYVPPPIRLHLRGHGFDPDHAYLMARGAPAASEPGTPGGSYGGSDQSVAPPASNDSSSDQPAPDQSDGSGDDQSQQQPAPQRGPPGTLQIPGAPGVRIPSIPTEGL